MELAVDDTMAAIVRATALDLMRPLATPQSLQRVAELLHDDSSLVRAASVRLHQASSPQQRIETALLAIRDPVRAVRLEAARLLLGVSLTSLAAADQAAARHAIADYQDSLSARADYPETQMQIAGLAMTFRDFSAAQNAFHEALSMDPQLADAWITVARIQAALRRPDVALRTLEQAARANPENGQVSLQLGALYVQLRDPARAASTLEKALEQLGPSPGLLDLLAATQLQAGNWERARSHARKLVDKFPMHQPSPLVRQVLRMKR
jgi:tetratricopeptide (TPR) repeat protein